MNLQQAYNNLSLNSKLKYLYYKNEIIELDSEYQFGLLHIVPGSFNPIHEAHWYIYDNIPLLVSDHKLLEISISRLDKSSFSLAKLEEILSQFKDENVSVLITNAPRIIDKVGLIKTAANEIHIHIGYDNYQRLIKDYGKNGLNNIHAQFHIYDRNGQFEDSDLKNCIREPAPQELANISSSNLRINK